MQASALISCSILIYHTHSEFTAFTSLRCQCRYTSLVEMQHVLQFCSRCGWLLQRWVYFVLQMCLCAQVPSHASHVHSGWETSVSELWRSIWLHSGSLLFVGLYLEADNLVWSKSVSRMVSISLWDHLKADVKLLFCKVNINKSKKNKVSFVLLHLEIMIVV